VKGVTLARKQTGLRNRYRRGAGLSTYARQGKRKLADSYGSWQSGKRVGSEVIAGRSLAYSFIGGANKADD